MKSRSPGHTIGHTIAWVVWLALMIWGLWGVTMRFTQGHELANYGSYVPWGLWVAGYIYFIGLSAGAFLLSSLIFVFRLDRLRHIARLALFCAALTLLMALLSIWFDLGHMWRAYEVLTRPDFSSMMAWMIWLYSAYFILILTELWLDMRCDLSRRAGRDGALSGLYRILSLGYQCPDNPEDLRACREGSQRGLRFLGLIGIPLAITFHGGVGALFGTVSARPYWNSSLFPILFILGALVSGGALVMAVTALTDVVTGEARTRILGTLSKIVLSILVFDLILEWAEFSIPMWYRIGHEYELMINILFGEFWYVFWVFHILLGFLVPIALLAWNPRARWSTALGGGLIATTYMAVRLNMVIPGLITPQLRGLGEAYTDHRLRFEYLPSAFEWAVLAFVVALGTGLFYLGRKLLPLAHVDVQTAGSAE